MEAVGIQRLGTKPIKEIRVLKKNKKQKTKNEKIKK
jgi:hypothetical protein